MIPNRVILLMLVIVAVAFLGCDCEPCPEVANPPVVDDDVEPQPSPGPTIIGRPTGSATEWEIGGDPAVEGPSMVDPATADYCKLRTEFMGLGIHTFKFHKKSGGIINNAQTVRLSNDDVIVQIDRSPINTFVWTVYSKATDPLTVLCSNLIPTTGNGAQAPAELFQMKEMWETVANDEGKKLELKAKLP